MSKLIIKYNDGKEEEYDEYQYFWTLDSDTRMMYIVSRTVESKYYVLRIPFETIRYAKEIFETEEWEAMESKKNARKRIERDK